VSLQTKSQVEVNENPLDIKCGLIHSISRMQMADSLFDVKLAFSSFNARNKSGNLNNADDVLTEEFVERVQFRLWTSAKTPVD
jgi:hypothetical protein